MTDLKPMYRGVVGDRTTELMNSFDAAVDTKMTVFDTSIFPPAPNYVTVRMANKSCLAMFKYTGISGNQITGLTFEESDIPLGETAKYPIGSFVYWSLTNKLLTNIEENIEEIGAASGVQHASKTVYGVVKIGDGIDVDDGVISCSGGGGGTNNYNSLINKPKINGVELQGNKTLGEIGAASVTDLATETANRTSADTALQTALNGKVNINQGIAQAGKYLTVNSSGNVTATPMEPSTLPIASSTTLGAIKVGTGLEIDSNGKLNNKVIAKVTDTTLVFDDGTATVAGTSLVI